MATREFSTSPLRPEVLRPRVKITESTDSKIEHLQRLANLMDTAFEVPGTNIRFGLDALIGLVPGLGDTVTSLVALYIVASASRLGVGRATLIRMISNVAIDWFLGLVPFLGDLFDVYWKANQSNVAILRKHLEGTPAERRRAKCANWATMLVLATLFACVLAGGVFFVALAVKAVGLVLGV